MVQRRSIHPLSRAGLVPAMLAFALATVALTGAPRTAAAQTPDSTRDRGLLLIQLDTLMRRFGDEPFRSADRMKLERQIQAAVQALRAASVDERAAFTETRPRPFMRANFDNVLPRGWIGLNLDGPHELSVRPDGEYIRYFDYPEVLSVEPNSPAERAGLQHGDLVIAYDGSDLRRTSINVTRMFVPDRRIAVAVRRDGEPRRYTVVVGRAPDFGRHRVELNFTPMQPSMAPPAPPDMPADVPMTFSGEFPGGRLMTGAVVISMNGVFGAALSTVNADLAKALGLSRGVLVTEAPRGTPAAVAGLRAGDVIVRVGGHAVASVPELRAAVMRDVSDGAVTLDVMREKKVRRLKVTW